MEVRLAKREDFDDFLKIKIKFNEEYGISKKDKEFILEEFDDYFSNGAIILALENKIVVGYLCGIIEKDMYEKTGYLGELFVLKEYRGKGISTKIKDVFLEFLKSKKIKICRIDVNPENNAQEVYKKWGFKIDKYRMSLHL